MSASQGKENIVMCFKGEGETSLLYFVFFQALFHLMQAELSFVGNNLCKHLCPPLGSQVLQCGTAQVAPEEACGLAAIAQLSSGVYGLRDAPLQIKGIKMW